MDTKGMAAGSGADSTYSDCGCGPTARAAHAHVGGLRVERRLRQLSFERAHGDPSSTVLALSILNACASTTQADEFSRLTRIVRSAEARRTRRRKAGRHVLRRVHEREANTRLHRVEYGVEAGAPCQLMLVQDQHMHVRNAHKLQRVVLTVRVGRLLCVTGDTTRSRPAVRLTHGWGEFGEETRAAAILRPQHDLIGQDVHLGERT
ncbi:hypothetical protein FGB62_361g05 [Gracilaria domingensis]|nr:hypothetical protein FGB62_361g05 [Gracilaria domingensis]